MDRNIVAQVLKVTKAQRQRGYKSCILWLTGLPSSGKSTIACALDEYFFKNNVRSYILDGDNIRMGLNSDLGFSQKEREENIRRIGEVAKLFVDAGVIAITAFISPYRKDRDRIRQIVEKGEFLEVHVKCPVNVCEQRDVKGLYKKARQGVIKQFTGVDDPYEEPLNPEIVLETSEYTLDQCVGKVIEYLKSKQLIS